MRYVALLRGINVGGHNPVSMAALKLCFESLGFTNVKTYINSGNVLFDTQKTSKTVLVEKCEDAIEHRFGFKVVCSIISAEELASAFAHMPDWWGTSPETKHDAIFVIAPKTATAIMAEVGEPKPEYEQVAACEPVIFWSAPIKTFHRTRYRNVITPSIYKSVTIRNANTFKKLAALATE